MEISLRTPLIQNKNSFASCAVIIVTHKSQLYLETCIQALKKQTQLAHQLIIVDSGSPDTRYLQAYAEDPMITLHLVKDNIGFCQANNLGMSLVDSTCQYVLFLNPDAFLTPTFLAQAVQIMQKPNSQKVGALSGILLGYHIQDQQPTGTIDSTGIFRTWYGKWYDRAQGVSYHPKHDQKIENVPALCGALMFCRMEALKSVEFAPHIVMDPSFYMYKEDIDLSIRLRKKYWVLQFNPALIAYHCRGWKKDRSQVPRHLRLLSAKNEMRLYVRLKSPCLFYSVLKYLAVKGLNR